MASVTATFFYDSKSGRKRYAQVYRETDLQAIPLLFVITVICFTLINLAPYDAVDSIITPDMTQEEIEYRKEEYGLNDPVVVQYGKWLLNLLQGDMGYLWFPTPALNTT